MTYEEIVRRLAGRKPLFQDINAEYAVLAPLVAQKEGLSLLFEIRAGTLRRQPGEVCFPLSAPCGRRRKSWAFRRARRSSSPPWTAWAINLAL